MAHKVKRSNATDLALQEVCIIGCGSPTAPRISGRYRHSSKFRSVKSRLSLQCVAFGRHTIWLCVLTRAKNSNESFVEWNMSCLLTAATCRCATLIASCQETNMLLTDYTTSHIATMILDPFDFLNSSLYLILQKNPSSGRCQHSSDLWWPGCPYSVCDLQHGFVLNQS